MRYTYDQKVKNQNTVKVVGSQQDIQTWLSSPMSER